MERAEIDALVADWFSRASFKWGPFSKKASRKNLQFAQLGARVLAEALDGDGL